MDMFFHIMFQMLLMLHQSPVSKQGVVLGSQALDGVKYLFLVTDFYGGAQGNAEIEIQQGKNAVDAAKEVSSAPSTNPIEPHRCIHLLRTSIDFVFT